MPLTTGLVAYWSLDEASGSRADSSGGGNTLTDVNTVTQNPGKISTAAQFTAANSERLSVADNAALSLGASSLTLSAWVYFDSKGAVRFIAGKNDGVSAGGCEYLLYYDNGLDRFRFQIIRSDLVQTFADANTLGSPATATWYFIVAWYDNTSPGNSYIQINNGTVDTVLVNSTTGNDSTTAFVIGAAANGASLWDGRIDEVGVWKRILTAPERTQLYGGGLGFAYPFIETLPLARRAVALQAVNRRAVR